MDFAVVFVCIFVCKQSPPPIPASVESVVHPCLIYWVLTEAVLYMESVAFTCHFCCPCLVRLLSSNFLRIHRHKSFSPFVSKPLRKILWKLIYCLPGWWWWWWRRRLQRRQRQQHDHDGTSKTSIVCDRHSIEQDISHTTFNLWQPHDIDNIVTTLYVRKLKVRESISHGHPANKWHK